MNSNITERPSPQALKWVKVITHFLCLCIIFVLPEVIMGQATRGHGAPWPVYIKSAIYIAIFYLNYYLILDSCMGRRGGWWRLIGWNLLIIAVSLMLTQALWRVGVPREHDNVPLKIEMMRKAGFMVRDAVMVILTVALSIAMRLGDGWIAIRRRQEELEARRQREELQQLKSQLNPHFLFNTLNSIYALVAIDPEKSQRAIHELSALLRYVLYENAPTVPLQDELAFVDNYVKLMKLRIGDAFPVNVTLDAGNCGERHVAPLLFISPVENAFKHGNTGSPDDHIDISIMARDGLVSCIISNHYDSQRRQSGGSGGIGNMNLSRRLELIYGSRASMDIKVTDDTYTVTLIINLNS